MTHGINFFNENISYIVRNKGELRKWIRNTIEGEGNVLGDLNFILCDDSFLVELNEKYLNNKDLTDIITFSLDEESGAISGDIFISLPRVKENAGIFQQKMELELHRVMIHGVLHLMGHKDSSNEEGLEMREKEDFYLGILQSTSLSYH